MYKLLIILLGLNPLIIGAQVWQHVPLSIGNDLNAIQFIDINNGWIVGDGGIILKYDNNSWTSIESEFSSYNLTGLYFTDSVHGWIIGENGVILKYNNDTIFQVVSPTEENLYDIHMLDENYGWICGGDRTILEFSENIWSIYPTGNFSNNLFSLRNIQFYDSTFGIIIGGYFTILNYEDGEWYEDNNTTNTTWLTGLFIQDEENIITTENQALPGNNSWGNFIKYNTITGGHINIGSIGKACGYCDIDFGETMGWAICDYEIFKYENNRFVKYNNYRIRGYLNSICIVNDSVGWIVGNNAVILKYNSQFFMINDIVKNKIKVYPNPFQDYIIINSTIPLRRIEIFNVNGERIEYIKVYNEFSLEINSGNFPKGVYFMLITGKDSEYIYKIIKK